MQADRDEPEGSAGGSDAAVRPDPGLLQEELRLTQLRRSAQPQGTSVMQKPSIYLCSSQGTSTSTVKSSPYSSRPIFSFAISLFFISLAPIFPSLFIRPKASG